MQTFFTADEHLGHDNIIKFCNRPFLDMDQMVDNMIWRHNCKVGPDDTTVHIGDMFWRSFGLDRALSVMNRLNGQHIYVWGNHDELIFENPSLQAKFKLLVERLYIPKDGSHPAIVCDHFAGRVWNGSHRGSWQLYGHSHGELPFVPDLLSMDVGVDQTHFEPLSLAEVGRIMEEKKKIKLWNKDHTVRQEVVRKLEYGKKD